MDYYLKTTNKQDFINDLRSIGIEIDLENDYYQNESIIIDWIGQIPNPIEFDENGEPIGEITYKEGQHVNIRSIIDIDTSQFTHTTNVYPDTPYRMFS